MQQEFRGDVGFVVNGDMNHSYRYEPALPADASVARECPQCRRLTWRYTQHCIHCSLDLSQWDIRQQLFMHRRATQRQGSQMIAGGLTLLGSSWILGRLDIWPEGQLIACVLGIGILFVAAKMLEG